MDEKDIMDNQVLFLPSKKKISNERTCVSCAGTGSILTVVSFMGFAPVICSSCAGKGRIKND